MVQTSRQLDEIFIASMEGDDCSIIFDGSIEYWGCYHPCFGVSISVVRDAYIQYFIRARCWDRAMRFHIRNSGLDQKTARSHKFDGL